MLSVYLNQNKCNSNSVLFGWAGALLIWPRLKVDIWFRSIVLTLALIPMACQSSIQGAHHFSTLGVQVQPKVLAHPGVLLSGDFSSNLLSPRLLTELQELAVLLIKDELRGANVSYNQGLNAAISSPMSIGIMILVSTLFMAWFFYRNGRLQAETNRQIIIENESLNKALHERETLLKEIHHRVKNNLQIVASLLCLQSNRLENEELKKVLEDGQSRVRSMMLIHQKLYENEDFKHIAFRQYLNELITEVKAAFGSGMDHAKMVVLSPEIRFEAETAVPLGLIVTELATNAFKHAFNEMNCRPELRVRLIQKSIRHFSLIISDNGTGIDESQFNSFSKVSFGLNLIKLMSTQLNGAYTFDCQNGTTFTLHFTV